MGKKQKPVRPLNLVSGLTMAAKDHVKDQSVRGGVGHQGSDGSSFSERFQRYGCWSGISGENVCYGQNSARNIVMSLIVDDGVPTRGHRSNIFHSQFNFVGIACG